MPAAQLSGAIEIFSDDSAQNESRRKVEAMKRLAFLDHLTQLPNRRYLEMAIHTAQSEFEVHHDPFGVLMMDLDGFKKMNDTYGHGCGDLALQEAAKTLAGALRPTDSGWPLGRGRVPGDRSQCGQRHPGQTGREVRWHDPADRGGMRRGEPHRACRFRWEPRCLGRARSRRN